MVALVKGPLYYFLQMFPNLVFGFAVLVEVQGLGLGFSTLIPNLVHSTTHSPCVTVTLQVTDE